MRDRFAHPFSIVEPSWIDYWPYFLLAAAMVVMLIALGTDKSFLRRHACPLCHTLSWRSMKASLDYDMAQRATAPLEVRGQYGGQYFCPYCRRWFNDDEIEQAGGRRI
jgi:hypothetical protein